MRKHIGVALGLCLSLTLLSVSSVSSAAPQIVGTKCFLYNVNASKYPEILRISEMISLTLPNFEKIQSEEYEKIKGGL